MQLRPEIPGTWAPAASEEKVLLTTLASVKKRRGLIHGKYSNGGVCALGALGTDLEKIGTGICVDGNLAREIQRVNDSVPKATKAERRAKVIRWIERRLKKLKGKQK